MEKKLKRFPQPEKSGYLVPNRKLKVKNGDIRRSDIMIIEGYARPAPLPGTSVPISTVAIDPGLARPTQQTITYPTWNGKPDMGLMEYPEEDGTLPQTTPTYATPEGTYTTPIGPPVLPGDFDGDGMPDEYDPDHYNVTEPEIEEEEEKKVQKMFTADQRFALIGLVVIGFMARYYKRQ